MTKWAGGRGEGQQEGNCDGQETKNTSDVLYLELFIQAEDNIP